MPPRQHRRTEAATIEDDDEIVSDGFAARVADRLLENPALSGGLFVMALTATAIISNAVVLQSARHPDPLFATRPAPVASASDADTIPVPRPRADQVGAITAAPAADPPLPRPPPLERQVAKAPAAPLPDPALVSRLQKALAARGLYAGAIDGISGSRTRAAITAYQKAEGLPVTGQPSPAILDRIVTASLPPPPVIEAPAPPVLETPAPIAAAPKQVKIIPVAVQKMVPAAEPAPVVPVATRPAEIPEATAPEAPAETPAAIIEQQEIKAKIDAEIAARDRYLAIQRALNRAGYGPVPEDGEESAASRDAIRRFELDNGLPITGAPEDHVVDRLIAIGAMAATVSG